jgi:hypothetical protein
MKSLDLISCPIYLCCCSELELEIREGRLALKGEVDLSGADLLRGDIVDRTIKEEERRTETMPDPRLEASTTGNI